MNIDLKFLCRGFSHKEWSEVTGYDYRTLVKFASEKHPAWKRQRWWPAAWLGWTLGYAETPQRGRKRLVNPHPSIELESVITKLVR